MNCKLTSNFLIQYFWTLIDNFLLVHIINLGYCLQEKE